MSIFKEMDIKPRQKKFEGDKIKVRNLVGKEIEILDYEVKKSKFEGNADCIHMQIILAGEKRLVFVDQVVLVDMITQVPKDRLPTKAKILKDKEFYEFE